MGCPLHRRGWMRWRIAVRRWLGGVAVAVAVGAASVVVLLPASAGTATAQPVCQRPSAGRMGCLALRVPAPAGHLAPQATPKGYGPADLRSAYRLPGTGGAGQTVAIVDAYDYPSAESDLATYRTTYGLPACTTANGCFRKVDEHGGTRYPKPAPKSDDWTGEEALDIDMVSAVCPQCQILLLEASSPTGDNLGTAVDTAVKLGAKYVSNSYGGDED